jgi:hypothetical protein
MFRCLMRIAGGLLVAFHVWLLAGHLATGQFLEPERLFRWVITAGLAAGIILLRRQGATLFGRRALVVWLLAGMLHVPAIANRLDSVAFDTPVAISLTQLTLVSVAAGLGLRLFGRIPVRRPAAIRRPDFVLVVAGTAVAISSGSLPHLASRPPPRA